MIGSVKLLGFDISSDLPWNIHINVTIKKAPMGLYYFYWCWCLIDYLRCCIAVVYVCIHRQQEQKQKYQTEKQSLSCIHTCSF